MKTQWVGTQKPNFGCKYDIGLSDEDHENREDLEHANLPPATSLF